MVFIAIGATFRWHSMQVAVCSIAANNSLNYSNSGQETSRNPSNLRSVEFRSSATPAILFVVVYSAFELMEMANPVPALESKASSKNRIIPSWQLCHGGISSK